jgi:uncharacterized protein (DUF1697 family)
MRMIVLLRGINVGSRNRIAMPALRDALTEAGMQEVRTYVQSGNVLLETDAPSEALTMTVQQLISERFELSIPVVVRTRDELAAVVAANPLGDVASDPKRYQVSFLSEALAPAVLAKLQGQADEPEQLVMCGRELYAWHPDGVARSKLWAGLAGTGLGVTATARNWTTVMTLLELADER